MSGHADATPRIHESMHFYEIVEQWDALVTENQQLRDALEGWLLFVMEYVGDPEASAHIAANKELAILTTEPRAALDGTPSEDPPIEDLPDPSHDDVRGRAPSFNLFRKPSEDT
jgi:hypothetical protein